MHYDNKMPLHQEPESSGGLKYGAWIIACVCMIGVGILSIVLMLT